MHTRQLRLARGLAVAAVALLVGACGGSGDDTTLPAETRAVDVEMVDIAFVPKSLTVAKGEEVRFVFTNSGKVRHEGYIGTAEEQADHEKEMKEGDDGGHEGHGGGGDERKVTVEPGEKGELTHRFDEAGTFEVGCHEPGHYAAGMKITVEVS